ncbi:hypothetical protein [Clostridium sp. ZS2-4]|uniref:hypothetical protein n=1 Tax=Clostridium sp. ZS2-4 TaxID=2987703 RepID=UPI00227C975E|nr:hypothetical protein [Clostridium sp. ZS2-4]MCY6354365.1 hypothetical protein [Clostridium sp. ZS2-4]
MVAVWLKDLLDSLDYIDMEYFVFKSRKGQDKPITRQQALNILKDAAISVGVNENIGIQQDDVNELYDQLNIE